MNNNEKIAKFLKRKNIVVAGVSRDAKKGTGMFIFKKFADAGYNTFALNPNSDEIDGVKCYRSLKSIPGKVDAVFSVTNPSASLSIAKECAENDINMIWFHRFVGAGSYIEETIKYCKENKIEAVTYGCPAMFLNPDFGHKCFKFILKYTGKLN